jgi:hypothetical protein
MRRRRLSPLAPTTTLLALAISMPALALPPGEVGRGFRDGANHHLGDDSFGTATGHGPLAIHTEAQRMQTHLKYVRAVLGAGSATRPEFAPRRAELLSLLDAYIDKGATPKNAHLPWRSPVFIDDEGTICAVGYLIERTRGRAFAELIAREHRYDYLEDIAAKKPEVADWIANSGFALTELASIQPGYNAPVVEQQQPWDLGKNPLSDGPFEKKADDGVTRGTVKDGQMAGSWTKADAGDHVIGRGTLKRGVGTWQSYYPDGARMAEGKYSANRPSGAWRFYHASGHLAAIGSFELGVRHGGWQFFQDDDKKTPIATGQFEHGTVSGVWRHFDAQGELLATSRDQTPAQWSDWGKRPAGHLLAIVPGSDGAHHWVHSGNVMGDSYRIDLLSKGNTRLYVVLGETVYDDDGNKLTRDEGGVWRTQDCHWNAQRKRVARAADLTTLHGLIFRDRWKEQEKQEDRCATATPVSEARGKRIDALLANVREERALSPEMVRKLVLGEETLGDVAAAEETEPTDLLAVRSRAAYARDFAKTLAGSMTWYVEWPHVDGRFLEVFHTLAGYGPLGD